MNIPRILLIDDDEDIRNTVLASLNSLVSLDYATNFDAAIRLLKLNNYSLILLDIYLGDENGLEVARFYKDSNYFDLSKTIIITSDTSIDNEIKGHELGALDYLKKPFNAKLLRSLLNKHLLKILKSPKDSISAGPFLIDFLLHEASLCKNDNIQKLNLTQCEFKLLSFFIENQGRIFSREVLFDRLWDDDSNALSRTIDMHISSLRKKIHPYSKSIKNKRGIGYYLIIEE